MQNTKKYVIIALHSPNTQMGNDTEHAEDGNALLDQVHGAEKQFKLMVGELLEKAKNSGDTEAHIRCLEIAANMGWRVKGEKSPGEFLTKLRGATPVQYEDTTSRTRREIQGILKEYENDPIEQKSRLIQAYASEAWGEGNPERLQVFIDLLEPFGVLPCPKFHSYFELDEHISSHKYKLARGTPSFTEIRKGELRNEDSMISKWIAPMLIDTRTNEVKVPAFIEVL